MSNREIADELIVSQNTVIRHVSNIYSKTGCSSRAEATLFAVQLGVAGQGVGLALQNRQDLNPNAELFLKLLPDIFRHGSGGGRYCFIELIEVS